LRLRFQCLWGKMSDAMKALLVLLLCLPLESSAQKNVEQQMLPRPVLEAKTIGLFPYWPGANTSDLLKLQQQAQTYLTQWGRFAIVPEPSKADIVAFLIVGSEPGGYAPTRGSLIAAAIQQMGQNISCASGPCYVTPPHYVYERYDIYTGTIVLIKGSDLGKPPDQIQVLWSESKRGGSKPILDAAKAIRKFVEKGDKIKAEQDAVIAFDVSMFEKLTADRKFTHDESQQHFLEVLQQLKAMGVMRKASNDEMKQAIAKAGI